MVLSLDEARLIPPWLHIVAVIVMLVAVLVLSWLHS